MIRTAELIRRLQQHDPDSFVLLSIDSEGTCSPLDDISVEMVEADYTGGEIDTFFDEDEMLDKTSDVDLAAVKANFKEVLVFWPE